jgi:hypothetical protein
MDLPVITDDRVVASTRDDIARVFPSVDTAEIEKIVSEELAGWRERSRVQTFVPIFAQRTARERILHIART